MSTGTTLDLAFGARAQRVRRSARRTARPSLASDAPRAIHVALGLVWLLDGALQFQSFMYGHGFIQMLKAGAAGEPSWIAAGVTWPATLLQGHQLLLNTSFALVQVAIGLGILYRPAVKAALLASFGWAFVVWWSGEAFGALLTGAANPLTGAPGAVILYALVGAVAWPNGRPGGLLGERGTRRAWAILWLLMGALWLLPANRTANAGATLIAAAPSGMAWLNALQRWTAAAAAGHGLVVALVLAGVSWSIGIAVARRWHARWFLAAAVLLNLVYWVVGQGLGGIAQGGATDPNAGPLFILLAYALYSACFSQYASASASITARRE